MTQKFINPLTVDAFMFLNVLEQYNQQHLDPVLIDTLEKVVNGIEKFISKSSQLIVDTQTTQVIPTKDLECIKRFYHCNHCKKDLGKTSEQVAEHLGQNHDNKSDRKRSDRKRKGDGKKEDIFKLPKKATKLISHDFIKNFNETMKIAETLKHIPEYDKIESDLMNLISPLFPNESVKIYKFGSRISGIGTPHSDLDLFVNIGNSFQTFENRASPKCVSNLRVVAAAIRKNPKDWRHLVVIDNARVPILKVKNAHTGIECDIGFSNSLGYCNTQWVQYNFELQPVVRRICIFMKKWLERTKLSEHISSYAITLMVITYMQKMKYLPSVELLQKDLSNPVFVGPWTSNYYGFSLEQLKISKIEITSAKCQQLLKDFCEFYSKIDYAQSVICPYLGDIQPVAEFENKMPISYTDFVGLNPDNNSLQLKKFMIVQDPFQLNHNVTKSVAAVYLSKFIQYLQQTAVQLEQLQLN